MKLHICLYVNMTRWGLNEVAIIKEMFYKAYRQVSNIRHLSRQ